MKSSMGTKTDCYVDTSAFIAFLDRSDFHHPLYKRLFAEPPRLVTSALVIAEGHGWFLRRYDRLRATQFLAFARGFNLAEIVNFDAVAIRQAEAVISRFSDQNLTLADAHGIAIMGGRKFKGCWSTDRHLALAGVPLVV